MNLIHKVQKIIKLTKIVKYINEDNSNLIDNIHDSAQCVSIFKLTSARLEIRLLFPQSNFILSALSEWLVSLWIFNQSVRKRAGACKSSRKRTRVVAENVELQNVSQVCLLPYVQSYVTNEKNGSARFLE